MFETERLIIRAIEEADLPLLKRGLNTVDYVRTITSRPMKPVDNEYLAGLAKSKAAHELPRYGICVKPEDYDAKQVFGLAEVKPLPVIGIISFQNQEFDFKNRGCTLGIGFPDPSQRGKGYGTEVLKWALDYGFYELGLHRIGLRCYSLNPAGIALYRRIGFIQEGCIREAYYSQGKWYDMLFFGLLEKDWAEIKSKST